MENVGRPVRVFWDNENEWYHGQIADYVPGEGYHIKYHDGDEEWLEELNGVEFEDEEVGKVANSNDEGNYEDDYGDNDYGATEESRVIDTQGDFDVTDAQPLHTLSVSPVSSPKRSARRNHEERESFEAREDKEEQLDMEETAGSMPESTSMMEEGSLDFQSSLHSTKNLNTNGVLIKGEVLGSNNLPLSADETQSAAGVFYRVLYAEGGDESSVFRCKTPIYKSEISYDLEFPRWEAEKKFRFEMVLPGDETLEESDFTDHGDVIVAVYRSRANGGSDFIGQVCIQLQDFIRVGTVGRARPNSHCRLIKGCFPLISRHGDIVGEGLADVDIDLSLEWRLVDKPSDALNTRSAIEEITARNTKQAGKKSGTNSVKNGVKKPKGKPGSGLNSSAAMSTLKASRRNRQQTFLDAQNDKMRSRLERAGPKQTKRPTVSAGHKATDNSTISEIYRPTADRAAAKKKSSVRKEKGAKDTERKRTGTSSASVRPLNLNLSHDELVIEYEILRKKVGEANLELKSLHTMDSKLKAQVTKSEAVTARLKKVELKNRKKSNLESFMKENGEAETKEASSESFYSVKNILLRAGIEDDEETLDDELLRERLVEHSILQETRTGCLERIRRADELLREEEVSLKKCQLEVNNKLHELESRAARVNKPKNDWNLHVLNKESKLASLQTEVTQLNMIRKLNLDPEMSKAMDEAANSAARIDFLETTLRQKSDEVEGLRFEADNWKERLSELQRVEGSELSLATLLRQSIATIRNSLSRLKRQEKLMEIKRRTDAVELEVLRHDLSQKQSAS
mmetsp:Transcript_19444/g.36241  ORF Transcript_19444/g.36241 Transcript_19444/m.36241 type:complete len:798 (-) Transcript_19444:87-2480(-)